MVKYKLKIIDIQEKAKGTNAYYIEKPKDLTWEAGAHCHIGLAGFDEDELPNKSLVRHMSIATLPEEGIVGFTTRVPGSSSEFKLALSKLRIGDEVTLFKVGSRMRLRQEHRPIILLSMGVGLATMRPMILAYAKNKQDELENSLACPRLDIPMLINVNVESSGEFLYQQELDKLVNDHYSNYWIGSRTFFYEKLQELSEGKRDAIYYVVGSDTFIKDIIQFLRNKKVIDSDIILDKKEEKMPLYFG